MPHFLSHWQEHAISYCVGCAVIQHMSLAYRLMHIYIIPASDTPCLTSLHLSCFILSTCLLERVLSYIIFHSDSAKYILLHSSLYTVTRPSVDTFIWDFESSFLQSAKKRYYFVYIVYILSTG